LFYPFVTPILLFM